MFKKLISLFLTTLFLAGCLQSGWTVKVDLTDEERQEVQATVTEYKDKIKNYEPDEVFFTPDPPIPFWVELARAYETLGQLGDALDTYEKAKDYYPRSQAIENNIGRLYEKAGKYEEAVEQYLYVAEEFQEPKYYYDITWVYIKAKDRKNAEKYFNIWQLATQKTDGQTQRAIKDLREEEKAN
ncbi:tetratricopeptide repeat protein [Candidatus Peregrinibacteria bacterium]|nr:tetratricopeptide repeat protein [Candidatus Peregrinibacteria bacterium]